MICYGRNRYLCPSSEAKGRNRQFVLSGLWNPEVFELLPRRASPDHSFRFGLLRLFAIAKLDRLARNVAFISNLMELKVEFEAVDFAQANCLTIHIMAAIAEHEAKMISDRTRGQCGRIPVRQPHRIPSLCRLLPFRSPPACAFFVRSEPRRTTAAITA